MGGRTAGGVSGAPPRWVLGRLSADRVAPRHHGGAPNCSVVANPRLNWCVCRLQRGRADAAASSDADLPLDGGKVRVDAPTLTNGRAAGKVGAHILWWTLDQHPWLEAAPHELPSVPAREPPCHEVLWRVRSPPGASVPRLRRLERRHAEVLRRVRWPPHGNSGGGEGCRARVLHPQ